MDNIEIYKHAKFQLEIRYNMGYAKITKFDIYNSEHCKLYNLKIYQILSIFMKPQI
jgi:hypothetical protein